MSGVIQTVFFDVDDTLIYFDPNPIITLKRLLAEAGLGEYTTGQLVGAFQQLDEPYYSTGLKYADDERGLTIFTTGIILQALGIEDSDGAYARKLGRELGENLGHSLYPDAQPALAQLQQEGYTLAAITGRVTSTEHVLEEFGLRQYFSYYMHVGGLQLAKSHPEFYARPRRDLGLAVDVPIALVDDDPRAVQFAASQGLTSVLIDRRGRYTQSPDPLPAISSLTELPDWLRMQQVQR